MNRRAGWSSLTWACGTRCRSAVCPLWWWNHHVPGAPPAGATVISGHGQDPIPTSSLLAFWCAGVLAEAEPWLWLAAVGLIGDMAEKAGFPEMEAARRFGVTALRDAATLVNAPRRSASGDAALALALLMAADGPKDVVSGERPEAAAVLAARAEVKRELETDAGSGRWCEVRWR